MIEKLPRAAEGLAAAVRARFRRMAGDRALYSIAPGYVHRSAAVYYDDTENTDNWQREVYEAARDIMKANDLHSVYDVGCGSGYKLVNTLGDFDSVGFDVPQTVAVLKARYPDRKWFSGPLDNLPKADLVICADVIEHVSDPDALMRSLVGVAKDWIIISTPDRNLGYRFRPINKFYYGPPRNPAHLREWTKPELGRYVARFLRIERHEITNYRQGTQMIVGRVGRPA